MDIWTAPSGARSRLSNDFASSSPLRATFGVRPVLNLALFSLPKTPERDPRPQYDQTGGRPDRNPRAGVSIIFRPAVRILPEARVTASGRGPGAFGHATGRDFR